MSIAAIVGPTASGKSALAMRTAGEHGGEIVSADSRQVYRGMDIGTAKPTAADRRRVPHHMLDVADPRERYDAARYQREAREALADLSRRGVRAIVVGGTGLYVRALLDGLDLAAMPRDPDLRARLEDQAKRDGATLHARLASIDPAAAARVDPRNVRRVIRYLEIATLTGTVSGLWSEGQRIPALKVGLLPPPDLPERIERRVREMVDRGVLDETARLLEAGVDPSLPSMSGHGYPQWARHLRGEIDLETAVALCVRDTKAYSKRQMTWFRKDPAIRWYDADGTGALALLSPPTV